MDDLISRAAAVRALASSNGDYLDALERIEKIPAVDAAPVVRCRDCKCWETSWKPNYSIDGEYFCPMISLVTSGEWFCAYGERRESE